MLEETLKANGKTKEKEYLTSGRKPNLARGQQCSQVQLTIEAQLPNTRPISRQQLARISPSALMILRNEAERKHTWVRNLADPPTTSGQTHTEADPWVLPDGSKKGDKNFALGSGSVVGDLGQIEKSTSSKKENGKLVPMKEMQELSDCDARPDGEGANSGFWILENGSNFGLLSHDESARLALDKRAASAFLGQSSSGKVGCLMRVAKSLMERGREKIDGL